MFPSDTFNQILRDLGKNKSIFFECDTSQSVHNWSYNGTKIDNIVDLIERIKSTVKERPFTLSETDLRNDAERVAGKLLKPRKITIEQADSVTDYTNETLKKIADALIQNPYTRRWITPSICKIEIIKNGELGETVYPNTEESLKAYTAVIPTIVDTVRNRVAQKLQTPIKISELTDCIGKNHLKIFHRMV